MNKNVLTIGFVTLTILLLGVYLVTMKNEDPPESPREQKVTEEKNLEMATNEASLGEEKKDLQNNKK